MVEIFRSGWENSGGTDITDAGIWKDYNTSSSPTVVTSPVFSGKYALKTAFSGGSGVSQNPMPMNQPSFHLRWLYQLLQGGSNNGDNTTIVQLFGTGFDYGVAIGIETDATGSRWYLDSPTAGRRYSNYFTLVFGKDYTIETQRTVGNGNGISALWIDDILVIQNNAEVILSNTNWIWCLGVSSSNNYAQAVIDEVVGSNTYIGPAPGTPPVAEFSFLATQLTVDFDASASHVVEPEATITMYSWDFGDGKIGIGQTVTHTYTANNTYSITLTVTDSNQHSASITKSVMATNNVIPPTNPNYDYTMVTDLMLFYLKDVNNNIIVSDPNPLVVFIELLLHSSAGHTAYVDCSFTVTPLPNTPTVTGILNAEITFAPTSLITQVAGSGMRGEITAPIWLAYCQYVMLKKPNIDGNAPTQGGTGSHPQGIFFENCDACLVDGANITQVRMFGVLIQNVTFDDVHAPCGVINSTITHCGWNGIQLNALKSFAYFNNCSHCSDVAISTYANSTRITDNTIHHMDGTTGGGGSARWGIAGESSKYQIIQHNDVRDCIIGIIISTDALTSARVAKGNLIVDNTLTNCQNGIWSSTGGFNTITRNTITDWGTELAWDYSFAIGSGQSNNDIISYNTLVSHSITAQMKQAVYLTNAKNVSVVKNNISIALTTMTGGQVSCAIAVCGSNDCLVQQNTAKAPIGVYVGSLWGVDPQGLPVNTKINLNDLANCATPISDHGTGTIVDPPTSAYNKLVFNNYFDGSEEGTYISNNTGQITITLPSGGTLNVDGIDNTMTAGESHVLSMNQDHFAYVVDGTATVTAPNVTVALTISAYGNGTVSPTGLQNLTINQTYTFMATGGNFIRWELNGVNVSTSPTFPLTITEAMNNQTLIAYFSAPVTITITATAGANGSVSPSGAWILTIGQPYQFTATPNANYSIDYWDLGGVSKGSSNPLQLTATADMEGKTLTALFSAIPPTPVTVNIAVSGNGTTDLTPGAHEFHVGDTITITAIPSAGTAFKQWQLDGVTYTDNPLSLTVTENLNGKTVTAEFISLTPQASSLLVPAIAVISLIGLGALYNWWNKRKGGR